MKNVAYYFENGKKIMGYPKGVHGELSYVCGDLTDVRGNLSYVRVE